VFGIAEQVRDSVNALVYQPGDVSSLARQLVRLAREPRTMAELAEASTWVLRGLPNFREMDTQYVRTFRAAVESSPVCEIEPADACLPIHHPGRYGPRFARSNAGVDAIRGA
jgi:hypothetical protein